MEDSGPLKEELVRNWDYIENENKVDINFLSYQLLFVIQTWRPALNDYDLMMFVGAAR